MANAAPITEVIPTFMRDKMAHPEVLPALLPQYLTELPLERAFHFIEGAMAHQEEVRLDGEKDPNKWFRIDKVEDVEVIERWVGGDNGPKEKLLGKKVRIHFKGTDYRNRSKITDQSIDTGWIEFHGWNPEQFAWETALARTIQDIATEAMEDDKGLYVQKIMYEVEDGEARYVGNARIARDSDNNDRRSNRSDEHDDDRGDRRKSNKSSRGKSIREQVEDAADEWDQDELLTKEDLDFAVSYFEEHAPNSGAVTDDDIWGEIQEYLEDDDIEHPKNEDDSQLVWMIQVLAHNVPDDDDNDKD